MTQPMRLSPDALLAHEPFVRAVVRDLLKDEHRVQDVLQETWIRALSKGPNEGGSLKGWLASVARRLALDEHRGSARRERRERDTARGEALESVDALQARLEAQREVVDAVLALEEPYKSVVLLAYYERLDSAQIAARLGRSAETVRSQLARAHEILRRKLDTKFGGDRGAWASVLLPWALGAKSKLGVAAAAGIAVALLGAGAWMLPKMGAPAVVPASPVALELPVEEAAPPPALGPATPEPAREAIQTPAASTQSAQKPDLTRLGRDELRELAVQAMRTLESKLLAPDPRLASENAELLALRDTGLAKIMMRTREGHPYEGLIFPRGGGCYYSFATRSHSYNHEPDIGYDQGLLQAGFYGAMVGMILAIGDVPIVNLSPNSASLPTGLDAASGERWRYLFALPPTDDIPGARAMQEHVRELSLGITRLATGTTYLVRTWSPGEHDHLVAVRVLAKDGDSTTIAWRILQRFAHAGEKEPPRPEDDPGGGAPAPAWMEVLDANGLVDLIHELRKLAEPMLFAIPESLTKENAWRIAGAQHAGFVRLLPQNRFAPIVEAPWGGACYSFLQQRYMNTPPEISLNGEYLSASMLLDLAKLDRAEFECVVAGKCPERFSGKPKAAWDFLWSTRSGYRDGGTKNRGLADADEQRWRDSFSEPGQVRAGHSFLLRALDERTDTDRMLLLTVLECSDDGATFAWRELKRFD